MCILDTEKMVWEKSRGTEFPRCAHSCIAVSLKDAIIAGVLTSSPNESDVESTTQDGLILYGGFSGNNVENSVLFITEGNIPTLLLSCWLHIMMVSFADQQTPSLPLFFSFLFFPFLLLETPFCRLINCLRYQRSNWWQSTYTQLCPSGSSNRE